MVWEVSDSVEEVTDGPIDYDSVGGRQYEVSVLNYLKIYRFRSGLLC